MADLLILADDLSGASEAAATFLLRTTRIEVHLGDRLEAESAEPARIVAVDTDARRRGPADVDAPLAAALTRWPDVPVLKKVDSLLRGPIVAELQALCRLTGAQPVVATALPRLDRCVVDGVLTVHGVPLDRTTLWQAEPRPAPATVAEALAPLPVRSVGIAEVRGPRDALAATLERATAQGGVPVCDAETEQDLDAVYAAAMRSSERSVLVGSAGLAAAAARALPADEPQKPFLGAAASRVLLVVGSAAPGIDAQLAALHREATTVLRLTPAELLADSAAVSARLGSLNGKERAAVAVDPSAPLRPEVASRVVDALAATVCDLSPGPRTALVLTGGETARAVLAHLGVRRLHPVREHAGAVISRADDGRIVATRPGSFGDASSLADLVTILLANPASKETT